MRTRIFFNHQTGESYELSQDQIDEARKSRNSGPFVMPDISGAYKEGGIRSPVDGSFITSRAQLRRHNNTHQCRQAGDFKPGELAAKENSRVQRMREKVANSGVPFEWK